MKLLTAVLLSLLALSLSAAPAQAEPTTVCRDILKKDIRATNNFKSNLSVLYAAGCISAKKFPKNIKPFTKQCHARATELKEFYAPMFKVVNPLARQYLPTSTAKSKRSKKIRRRSDKLRIRGAKISRKAYKMKSKSNQRKSFKKTRKIYKRARQLDRKSKKISNQGFRIQGKFLRKAGKGVDPLHWNAYILLLDSYTMGCVNNSAFGFIFGEKSKTRGPVADFYRRASTINRVVFNKVMHYIPPHKSLKQLN